MEPTNLPYRPSPQAMPPAVPPAPPSTGFFRAVSGAIRSRIFSGLLFIAPVVLTFWIVSKLIALLQVWVLAPLALLTQRVFHLADHEGLPLWWRTIAEPAIGLILVGLTLYLLGYLVRTWVARSTEWVLQRIPVVTTIYNATRNLLQSISDPTKGYSRVVLIEFPQPGVKSLAFVTRTLHDPVDGEPILAVCLLTGVMPPSGFTLFVRERDVVEVSWTVQQTIQAVLSGGMTSPETLRFSPDPRARADS